MTRVIDSPADLDAFGEWIASALGPGSVLALTGELGAGKTRLCKAIAAALGVRDPVTSPTFTLIHEYPSGRLPVYHFDFYRASQAEEILGIGWDDYLDRDGVLLVEWADKFPGLLPADTRWWHLAIDGPTRRTITLLPTPPEPHP